MWYLYRILIVIFFIFSPSAFAWNFFIEPLYWQATEADDWAYLNNNNSSTQLITYKTVSFNYKPGIRFGFGYERDWYSSFYYTNYYNNFKGYTSGNVVSSYIGATLAKPSSGFYNTGQVNFSIHYNIVDWEFGKRLNVTDWLSMRPLVGIEGGCINQTINSAFYGSVSTAEDITNKFTGVGPKLGLDVLLPFMKRHDYQWGILARFATSYLMGHWVIKDIVNTTNSTGRAINVPSRNMGALSFQSKVGVSFDYKKFAMSLCYEMTDWINQFQIYDDNTGTHTNDLTLQGLSFKLAYHFA